MYASAFYCLLHTSPWVWGFDERCGLVNCWNNVEIYIFRLRPSGGICLCPKISRFSSLHPLKPTSCGVLMLCAVTFLGFGVVFEEILCGGGMKKWLIVSCGKMKLQTKYNSSGIWNTSLERMKSMRGNWKEVGNNTNGIDQGLFERPRKGKSYTKAHLYLI